MQRRYTKCTTLTRHVLVETEGIILSSYEITSYVLAICGHDSQNPQLAPVLAVHT